MFFRCLIWLLSSTLICLALTTPSLARGVSCETIRPGPVSGDGFLVLEGFYVAKNGIGELSCWVHKHPNGRDGLVTPHSWGETPSGGRQYIIQRIFETITKARSILRSYGTLDNDLYFKLSDTVASDRSGEAYWPNDGECWIELYLQNEGFRNYKDPMAQGLIAHEIGHCFLMDNISGYLHSSYDVEIDQWWDESGAEFFSSIIYTTLNREHIYSYQFDLDATPFRQPYNGVVLLTHYANLYGIDWVLGFLQTIFEQRSIGALLQHLQSENLDVFFHDFTTVHYNREIADVGGGTVPREEVVNSLTSHWLVPDRNFIVEPSIEGSRLAVLEMSIPAGYILRVYPPIVESARIQASIVSNGVLNKRWESRNSFPADCENEQSVFILISHLNSEPVRDVKIKYALVHSEGCAECVTPKKSLQKYGPKGKYGRPDYVAKTPAQGAAICAQKCTYYCVCSNKHMWSDRDATERECLRILPDGAKIAVSLPELQISKTLCQRHVESRKSALRLLYHGCHVRCDNTCDSMRSICSRYPNFCNKN